MRQTHGLTFNIAVNLLLQLFIFFLLLINLAVHNAQRIIQRLRRCAQHLLVALVRSLQLACKLCMELYALVGQPLLRRSQIRLHACIKHCLTLSLQCLNPAATLTLSCSKLLLHSLTLQWLHLYRLQHRAQIKNAQLIAVLNFLLARPKLCIYLGLRLGNKLLRLHVLALTQINHLRIKVSSQKALLAQLPQTTQLIQAAQLCLRQVLLCLAFAHKVSKNFFTLLQPAIIGMGRNRLLPVHNSKLLLHAVNTRITCRNQQGRCEHRTCCPQLVHCMYSFLALTKALNCSGQLFAGLQSLCYFISNVNTAKDNSALLHAPAAEYNTFSSHPHSCSCSSH